MAAGPGVTGIEGWRVALLLVSFIFITLSFEGLIDTVEKRLKKRKGLLTAFRALKNELLYLGFLSLTLSVTQEYLAMICIPNTSGSTYYKYKLKYGLSDHCGYGKEPLWPVSVQHETHYFIFAVAVTHICYCAITIALTLHKVGTWRKWEDEALAEAKSSSGDVKVMQETVSRSLIRSMCTSALATMSGHRSPLDVVAHFKALVTSTTAQFRVSVSQPMYHNVRLLFIEKMGLTYDFDYHVLVTNGMESQLAHAVHASWPLWMIATLFLVLPTPSYVPFWSYLLVAGLMLVVGAKLVSVTALLGMQVAIKYGDSVLFGRMEMEPKALQRTGPARRRLSLSGLADALGDTVVAPDGTQADGEGGGGGGEGGGGATVAIVPAGGAHVLDEALPAGAGVEVAAQVAAITALTSRQEALDLLRTMAAMPLLPEAPPPEPHPEESERVSEHPDDEDAAENLPPGDGSVVTGALPKLLPSPSLLLGIAPPRWGSPPVALDTPRPQASQQDSEPLRSETTPSPGSLTMPGAVLSPGSVTAPSPFATPRPTSAGETDRRDDGGDSIAASAAAPGGDGGGVATAAASSAAVSRPKSAAIGGGGSGALSPGVITDAGVRPASAARPGIGATPVSLSASMRPTSAVRPSVGALSPAMSASMRPPSAARPGIGAAPLALTASMRPTSAVRPSIGALSPAMRDSMRPPSAARPGTGVSPLDLGASMRPISPVRPGIGASPPAMSASMRPVSAVRPGIGASSQALAASMRPSSRAGLAAVALAANWANSTKRVASRRNAGLMLCGVATSRTTEALEQMEGALATAELAVAHAAEQQQQLLAAAAAAAERPASPAAVGVVAGFLASIRPNRKSEEVRKLIDTPRSAEVEQTPRGIVKQGSRLNATRISGAVMSPTGGGGGPTAAELAAGQAALNAAAAAAAFMRQNMPYKKPVRRCMSARQIMTGLRIGDEDFSKTMLARKPAEAGDVLCTNNATRIVGPISRVSGAGAARPSVGATGLSVGVDMLPQSNFGAAPLPPPPAAMPILPRFPRFNAALPNIGFFGPRKKKKAKKGQVDHPPESPEAEPPTPGPESSEPPPPSPAPEPSVPDVEPPPPPPAPEEPSPSGPPPYTSVFALYQMQQVPYEGTGGIDLLSVYDSLSALLPPGQAHLPGWAAAAAAAAPPDAIVLAVSPSGEAFAPPPPDGQEVTEGQEVTGRRRSEGQAAEGQAGEDGQPMVTEAGPPQDAQLMAECSAGSNLDLLVPEASSQSPRPSTLTLAASPDSYRPRSGLRVVRLGESGNWMTLEEAATMSLAGTPTEAPPTPAAAAADAADAAAAEDAEIDFAEDDEAAESPAPPSDVGRVLLPSMSCILEAPSLDSPPPAPSVAELPQRSLTSVFSMHSASGAEGIWPVQHPPSTPPDMTLRPLSGSSGGANSAAVRSAASFGTSGDLGGADSYRGEEIGLAAVRSSSIDADAFPGAAPPSALPMGSARAEATLPDVSPGGAEGWRLSHAESNKVPRLAPVEEEAEGAEYDADVDTWGTARYQAPAGREEAADGQHATQPPPAGRPPSAAPSAGELDDDEAVVLYGGDVAELEGTFSGFGGSAADLNKTATRIGSRDVASPAELTSRTPSANAGGPRMMGGAFGSTTSLVSLAPSAPDSDPASRQPSAILDRSALGSARGSRTGAEPVQEDPATMPAPPAAPPAPPPAPPPPAHLRLQVLASHGSGDAAPVASEGGRWATVVAQPPHRGTGSTIPEGTWDRAEAPPSPVSVRSWDDGYGGPVCEGSDGVGVGRDDVLVPEAAAAPNGGVAAAAAGGGGLNGANSAAGPDGGCAAADNVNAAGLAAGGVWRDLVTETKRQHAMSGEQQHHNHRNQETGHHHHHHSGYHHNDDSDSDDGHGGHCWPPCIPKPWAGHRVMPLPAPVQDLAENLGAGMDKAKLALTSAADNVKGKIRGHNKLQRKMSDHWLERVRNVLASHKGFENMDAAYFFWFNNPRVISYLFNWAYYENSLSIAMLIFSLILGYQEKWVFKGVPEWSVLVLLAADILILVHSCLYVLPLYALITPVGSHCPKDVLKRALKTGVFTRQTALIAKALHLQLKAREAVIAQAPPPTLFNRVAKRWSKPSGVTAAAAFNRAGYGDYGGLSPGGGWGALSPGGGGGGLSPGGLSPGWGGGASHAYPRLSRDLEAGIASPKVSMVVPRPPAERQVGMGPLVVMEDTPAPPTTTTSSTSTDPAKMAQPESTATATVTATVANPDLNSTNGGAAATMGLAPPPKAAAAAASPLAPPAPLRSPAAPRPAGAPPGPAALAVATQARAAALAPVAAPPPGRLVRLFRGPQAQPAPTKARGPALQQNNNISNNNNVSNRSNSNRNPADDVMPFTPSGAIASPTTVDGSPSGMDLSLLRGAGLERQDSKDSTSSSLCRSNSISALMAGMYRGAVTHLTPEEQRAAAANSRVVGRAQAGRGLDMTLVPERP